MSPRRRRSLPCLALAVVLLALSAPPAAEPAAQSAAQTADATDIALSPLFPHSLGDRWLFGDRAQQPTSSLMVSELTDRGFVLESDDGRTRVLTADPERGLLLVETTDLDTVVHAFDPPLVLLPARLAPGAEHSAESQIVERVEGEVVRTGTRSIRAEIGALVEVTTSAGRWRALPVTTETTTVWEGEEPQVWTDQTWYAAGVGPVRRVAVGGEGREELLLEAKVGERLLPP